MAESVQEALVARDVAKSYGRVKALDGVDLTVRLGEFVALLGPNGAGKSTLVQLLTGLFVADGGTLEVMGHDIRNSAVPALAHLGVVFQQPTLDLELTVLANLLFHARLHGLDSARAKDRISAELKRFELDERKHDKARTLSGGNRRRMELARALIHEPKLLLMDEPTVGLDPASRRDILDHVLRLKRERQIGVLWATHLVDEAERADRIVVLHRGKLLFAGGSEDLMEREGAGNLADAFLKLTGSDGPAGRPAAA